MNYKQSNHYKIIGDCYRILVKPQSRAEDTQRKIVETLRPLRVLCG